MREAVKWLVFNGLLLDIINLNLDKMDQLQVLLESEKIEADNIEIQQFFRSKLKDFSKLKVESSDVDLFNLKNINKVVEIKNIKTTKLANTYSQKLIDYRKKMNFTQQYFAHSLGLSTKTIVNWEKGETIPKSRFLMLDRILANEEIPSSEIEELSKSNEIPIIVAQTNQTIESKYIAKLEEEIVMLRSRLSKYE